MRLAKPLTSLIVYLVFASTCASAQLPEGFSGQVDWDEVSGIITFATSGSMPESKEGFFYRVPPQVKTIVIGANVRLTGGFRILFREKENPLHIIGRDRSTSVVFGTAEEAWTGKNDVNESDKWRYSAISVIEDAVVYVSNITALNPRGYIVSGYANQAIIHLESCSLLDTRSGDNNNSDGFAGASGSSLRNCFISTSDDGIKVYHDITIDNVTIEQHRNGAPLQFGWGGETREVKASIKDLVIKGVDRDGRYNMAPLTWEDGDGAVRHVVIDGLDIRTEGQMYDEDRKSWVPVGLLEIKPASCEFNLTATNARLHGLPLGLCNAKGNIQIREPAPK